MTGYLARLAARIAPSAPVAGPRLDNEPLDDPFERVGPPEPTQSPERAAPRAPTDREVMPAQRPVPVPIDALYPSVVPAPPREEPPVPVGAALPPPPTTTAPPVAPTGPDAVEHPPVVLERPGEVHQDQRDVARRPDHEPMVVEPSPVPSAEPARQPDPEPLAVADAFFARLTGEPEHTAPSPVPPAAPPEQPALPDPPAGPATTLLPPAEAAAPPPSEPPPALPPSLVIGSLTVEVVPPARGPAAPTPADAPRRTAPRPATRAPRTDLRRLPLARFGLRQG